MSVVKKRMERKGFTLVELLAVIVIIGAISVLAVSGVSRYVSSSRKEKVSQNKKNVAMSAQLYLQANRELLPRLVGSATTVKISLLRQNNYLKEDVTNADGEDCMDKSFVRVFKLDDDEYSYTTYLYCGDDEVPAEIPVPKPVVTNFDFTGGSKKNEKMSDVKDARFNFTLKGAEDDDTVGIYSYTYSIFVRNQASDSFTEVFNSGSLKGGLENVIQVTSQPLQSYISLTGYSNVRVDITAVNEQGGQLEYSKVTGEYEDKERPVCVSTEGEAKDDDDWVNKESYGADGNILTGQLRAYPGRVSVNCSDGNGSGCKRDKFTRSWPNNSKAVSEIGNYKLGARWSYVELEDNAQVANTIKCYVRANVDVQAPTVTVHVKRASDGKEISTITAQDSTTINAIMPDVTLASDKHLYVQGTGTEKWMNYDNFGTSGIYMDVDITDNLYLYSYEWKVNDPYVAGGTAEKTVAASASFGNVAGEGTTVSATGTFASPGMTDNPTNDEELKTAEHGSLGGTIKGLKITREGKRYGELKVCDKAKNCSTVRIYANIDVTPPLVPKTSYEKIKTKTNYDPANGSNYPDHYHWSNEYVRPYVEGQRDDKETQNPSKKVELSGWDQFKYSYQRQSGKSGSTYSWYNEVIREIHSAAGNSGRYGFDITDEGTHIVKFQSCDRAGNCSAFSVDDYVKVDTVKPTCDIVTKYAGTDANKITGEVKNKSIGSSNDSGWLKIGQQVTLSHSCEDKDDQFSSGCNETDAHNKQSYLFNSNINTSNAGANGYNTTYNAGDNTAGGHVVDYAGNMSDECPKMTVKIDHLAPKCKTDISWPEGNPTNPDNASKPETGWLGLVGEVGPGKKTAKVSQVCTDPPSTTGHMTGVLSSCDNAGTYDSHKYNQQFHIYDYEMKVTNAGSVDVGKSGKVIDIAGNTTDCPADRTVKIDYHKPVCTTKLEYGTGGSAGSFSVSSAGNPKNGWLGWYTNTNTTKKMGRVTQVCKDSQGSQKSGCYGTMLFKVYDTEMNVTNAGAVALGDNGVIRDKAMNRTDCNTAGNFHTLKIDYTRPVCEVKVSSTGKAANSGNNGEIVRNWNYANYDGRWLGMGAKVTINSKCTAAETGTGTSSGCDTNKSRDYIWEINTTKATSGGDGVNFYVYDKAGNRATNACTPKPVRIDLSGPICTLIPRYGTSPTNSSPVYDSAGTNASIPQYNGYLAGKYKVRVTSQCTGDKLGNGKAGSQCQETSIHAANFGVSKGSAMSSWKGSKSNGDGYTVFDSVGNASFCGRTLVRIDYKDPVCTVTAKKNGTSSYSGEWTNASFVRVSRTCSDSDSGCNAASRADQHHDYSTTNYWTTTEGGAISYSNSGRVTDNVGNYKNCPANKTIKLDVTKPTCTITTSGTIGSWTNKNVTIQGNCSDTGSGCKTTAAQLKVTFSTDTNKTYNYSKTLTDIAGNTNTCTGGPYTIKVQKTKPSCKIDKIGHNLTKLPCESGVDIYVSCYAASTNGAPLHSCADYTQVHGGYRIEGQKAGVNLKSSTSRKVEDVAGNVASCSISIYSKYQNRGKTVSCNRCSSASCETYYKCAHSDCGTYKSPYSCKKCCPRTGTSGGPVYRSSCDTGKYLECGSGTCYTTKNKECRTSGCGCKTRNKNCSKCNSTPSVSGSWTDGSNKGWSTSSNSDSATYWERRTVYY